MDNKPFYEYQIFIKNFNDYIEEHNKKVMESDGMKEIISLKKDDYGI